MSPVACVVSRIFGRFPRVSGDEPGIKAGAQALGSFSPRERG